MGADGGVRYNRSSHSVLKVIVGEVDGGSVSV